MSNTSSTNGIGADVDLLQAFPVLTERDGATRSTPTAGSRSDIGQQVEESLRALLAWRPRSGDTKGFVAALGQAFTIRDKDGHTEWEWTPRSYAIQADMGAVTGAQASIYARAKAALDQSLPLLGGLYPLRSDADREDVESVRAMVHNALSELVAELGQVGGPRLQRVDGYFGSLLGADGASLQSLLPEDIGGLFGLMRERLGLERDHVNTVDEEQDLTNYLILVDHTIALQRSWASYRHYFDRSGSDVFLGTQLVLLSRTLSVVADSVGEVERAMDSVYLDAAERQITRPPLQGSFRLTIAELLSWVHSVAAEEGPRLVGEAGKDGVGVLHPILTSLLDLVEEMTELSRQNPQQMMQGNRLTTLPSFHTPRVRISLQGLVQSLSVAEQLAGQLRRGALAVTHVFPSSGVAGTLVRLTIDGSSFNPSVQLILEQNDTPILFVPITDVQVVSDTRLIADINLPIEAFGDVGVVVIDGNVDSEPSGRFHIDRSDSVPPSVEALDMRLFRTSGTQGEPLLVPMLNDGEFEFTTPPFITFGNGIIIDRVDVLDPKSLEVSITIQSDAAVGPRDVAVITSTDHQLLPGAFTVNLRDSSLFVDPSTNNPGGGSGGPVTAAPARLRAIALINQGSDLPKATLDPTSFNQSVTPSRNNDGVETVRLTFDKAMETVAATITKQSSAGSAAGAASSGNVSVTPQRVSDTVVDLVADSNFAAATYNVVISAAGTQDTSGKSLATDISFTFKIQP